MPIRCFTLGQNTSERELRLGTTPALDGMEVVSYRWLGADRGDDLVQVEFQANERIIVQGGVGHKVLPDASSESRHMKIDGLDRQSLGRIAKGTAVFVPLWAVLVGALMLVPGWCVLVTMFVGLTLFSIGHRLDLRWPTAVGGVLMLGESFQQV